MKTLVFEQAYYGVNNSGYCVLGNSNPAYDEAIERICGLIGTPDGFSAVTPFLISTLSGDMLIMICGRMGAPDSSNRKTLFFHALYAPRTLCESDGVTAFRLFRMGKFAEHPESGCKQVTIDFEPDDFKPGSPPFSWDGEKLALICKSPANELMESLLGDKANRVSWASFTFAPLQDLKVYAISKKVSTPNDRICRDENGKEVFRPDQEIDPSVSSPTGNRDSNTTKPPKCNHLAVVFGMLFLLSAALNVILFVKPDLLPGFNSRQTDSIQELRNKFPKENIIDWEKERQNNDNNMFLKMLDNPKDFPKENLFLSKVKYNIDFLYTNIIADQKEASK